MARRPARCPESLNAAPANRQVSKQAEGEGQDEEPTKAFGLTIPPSVLVRADQVIEYPCSTNAANSYVRAVGFTGCSLPSYDRALHALRSGLDSWSGIGHVAVGMARQGYDLHLTRYDEKGWRATFYTTGMEHSPTSATSTGPGAHAGA